jgi:hypothetical protein
VVAGAVLSWMAGPYAIIAVLGATMQGYGWWRMARRRELSAGRLGFVSSGVLLTVLGMSVVREGIRIHALDVAALYEYHAAATRIGGLPVFLFFFVINGLLIAWVLLSARRALSA